MAGSDTGPTRGLLMGSAAGLRAGDWIISRMADHAICHSVGGSLV
jgi:hypothetical protein